MMDQVTLARQSYQLIKKDFGLEDSIDKEEVEIAFDWLEEYLTKQVNYLMDNDFNRLLNALYRIDISDSRTKELLSSADPSQIAGNIARAIIEREKQKVISRAQYRQPR